MHALPRRLPAGLAVVARFARPLRAPVGDERIMPCTAALLMASPAVE